MKKKKEILSIIIGMVAVLVILVGQFNYYPVQVKAMQEISIDDETESTSKQELKIFTNDAVSTAVQFSFQQILHFISDVYAESIDEVRTIIKSSFNPIEYFETLFQRIISTNAP